MKARASVVVGSIAAGLLLGLGYIALWPDPHLAPTLSTNEISARKMGADGLAFRQQGQYQEATEAFTQAIKLDPKDPEFLSSRASLEFFMEDFAGAKIDYAAALKIKPDLADAHRGLGVTYYAERDWVNAAAHLTQARAHATGNADTAMWAILAHKRNGAAIAPEDFSDIDRTRWPGQAVAFLFGEKDPLDAHIGEAAAQDDQRLSEYICMGSFVSLSMIQLENRVEEVSKEYAKIRQDETFLEGTNKTFGRCPPHGAEGTIGRREITFLEAR